MTNYGEAIKRPFTDFTKLLIGILLSILPIVNFFALGYILECIRSASKKKFDLPEWENWGDLFVSGFFSVVISFVYLLPAIISFMVTFFGSIIYILQGDFTSIIAKSLPLTLLSFVLLFLGIYLGAAATIIYAATKEFKEGFNLGKVFKLAFSGAFFGNALLAILISVVILTIFSFIPIIGAAIGSFVSGVIVYTFLGEVYGDS